MCTRGHWRPAEDEKLRDLVERYGPHNWNAIAEKLQGRSGQNLPTYLYIYIYNRHLLSWICGFLLLLSLIEQLITVGPA